MINKKLNITDKTKSTEDPNNDTDSMVEIDLTSTEAKQPSVIIPKPTQDLEFHRAFLMSKEYLKTCLPYGVSVLPVIAYNFTSNLLFSKLSQELLAANGLMTLSQGIFVSIPNIALFASGIHLGKAIAANQDLTVGAIFRNTLLFSLILSGIASAGTLTANHALLAMGQKEQLVELTQNFLNFFVYSVPPGLITTAITQLLLATGFTKMPLLITATNLALNLAIAAPLMLGLGPFPCYAEKGYGIGITLGNWLTCLSLTSYLLFSKSFKKYALFKNEFKGNLHWLKKLIKDGLPISGRIAIDIASLFASTLFVGAKDASLLLPLQVLTQYSSVLTSFMLATAQASSILLSQYLGRRQLTDSRKMGNTAIIVNTTMTSIMAGTMILLRNNLGSPFGYHPTTSREQDLLTHAVYCASGSMIAQTVDQSLTGTLRGYQDTSAAMGINLVVTTLGIGIGLLLSESLGPFGFILGQAVVSILSVLFLGHRWHTLGHHVEKTNLNLLHSTNRSQFFNRTSPAAPAPITYNETSHLLSANDNEEQEQQEVSFATLKQGYAQFRCFK